MVEQSETLRERRRRETRQEIAQIGLAMFDRDGYDETTMEEIASAAGVSARTLFHYFGTKDQILRYWLAEDFAEQLSDRVRRDPTNRPPMAIARDAMRALAAFYENEQSRVVDRVLNSTATLRASKQVTLLEWEEALHAALSERCPDEAEEHIRAVAMVATGALRLALESQRAAPHGPTPLAGHLDHAFGVLKQLESSFSEGTGSAGQ
jgi:AcrR family transcriptional regulator